MYYVDINIAMAMPELCFQVGQTEANDLWGGLVNHLIGWLLQLQVKKKKCHNRAL